MRAHGTNPFENLATEEYLLHYCEETGNAVLYLWQNENTVVIGRNQNAYTECNVEYIKTHNIRIVRRLTGGGAVYHDLGNLNYTIIVPKAVYDINRSTGLIVASLRSLGIGAENNGRNDICIDGQKISGNAYYFNDEAGMHHGTILFRVNGEKMESVLSVSRKKLSKHGIASVRARVGDICSEYPNIEISDIENAIRESFCREYGLTELQDIGISPNELTLYMEKYSSEAWNLEKIQEYDISTEDIFDWGNVRVSLCYVGEQIKGVEIATDSLVTEIIETIKSEMNRNILNGDREFPYFLFEKVAEEYRSYRFIINDIGKLFFKLWSDDDNAYENFSIEE